MYRHACRDDASQIAALHADNWRRFYRGAYLDSYLDGDVAADRLAVWGDRLSGRPDDCFTLVADDEGLVVGFVHTIFDADPDLGAYLENLHVRQDRHGRGIGKGLVIAAARELLQGRPGSGLFLWVLEQNRAAQGFYAALGGMRTRRELRGPFPGGGRAPGLRYAWPHPEQLLAAGPPQDER
jgi:ribosomal protein S18 acetylase RimI-like enzyme